MKSHRRLKHLLYEYHRGELRERDRIGVETHLAHCDDCRAELEGIRETIRLLDTHARRPSDRRVDLYWQQFAAKVEQRIERQEDESPSPIVRQLLDAFLLHRKPFAIGFASALALVVMVIGVWSVWVRTSPVGQTATNLTAAESTIAPPTNVEMVSAESRAQDYLEQSKVLLIGLMNTDVKNLNTSGPLLEREREISRRLVKESPTLTSSLNDPSQVRLRELISDLQLILVQIANLNERHDVPGVEIIKGGIQHNNILFKINLEQIQRTSKPVAKAGQTSKKTT